MTTKDSPAVQPSPPAPEADELLSIGAVAEATGLTPEALRMWERRYGRPEPVRLPSGHRRYKMATVRWLLRVTEAISRGHRPHRVMALTDAELDELIKPMEAPPSDPLLDELLAAVRAFDGALIQRRLVSEAERLSTLDLLATRVAPLIHRVGEAWREGALNIAHEHFLSEILEDLLRRLRATFPVTGAGPSVMLTTFRGEQHALGLLMVGLLAASKGLGVHLLGTETPLREIAAAAAGLCVGVVAISASLNASGLETDRSLRALRELLPPYVRLIAGGEGSKALRRTPAGVDRVTDLPSLDAYLEKLLISGERRPD